MSKSNEKQKTDRQYLAVDVGGTKVLAALVNESGVIVDRERCKTPRGGGPERVVAAIETAIDQVLAATSTSPASLTAIGIAIPGVVDPDEGRIVVTPNLTLTGVAIGPLLNRRYRVPVAVGNDGNVGALGERWVGSGRNAGSVLSICVGTGIGSGFVQGGKLWRGAREAAGEIGHIVMEIGGPKCGCGNRGCFEALASRTAIERDLRQAIAAGRTTILTELAEGDLDMIPSGMIHRALEADDPLVTQVMRRATEVIGYACLTVRHLLDPEVIVLGGGVIEACGDFMMPIIENIIGNDRLPGAREGGQVLVSALADDAVVLGAVALARQQAGRSPFKRQFDVTPTYATLAHQRSGGIAVGRKTYEHDIYITVNGKVKKRKKSLAGNGGSPAVIGPAELDSVCQGGPEILFIGAGAEESRLADEGRAYLERRAVAYQELPTPDAVEAYNRSNQRKAALLRVGKGVQEKEK